MIFNGVGFAKEIEEGLRRGGKLVGKRLVIFETGNKESVYVKLKKGMGERLGVKVEVVRGVFRQVEADGIVVQLPVESDEILRLIPPEKDVDGLNPEGNKFLPAAVVAVGKILRKRWIPHQVRDDVVGVVGSKGMVGKALLKRFGGVGFDVEDDLSELKSYDVVISATGQAGLIKPEMVKEGAVAIDLGYPKGDFDPAVAKKASFFTPVPGGVGPVTVVSLFENLSKTG